MRMLVSSIFTTAIILLFSASVSSSENFLDNWPHWRGPLDNGMAVRGNPPLKWDEKTNIKWKVEIPGKGSSTPIVWENRVFVTTAVDTKRKAKPEDMPKVKPRADAKTVPPDTYFQYIVICLDRQTGKEIWRRIAVEEVPHEGIQPTHSAAAGSPVTDGKLLYASFGSRGVYCYDFDGKLQWKKRLGFMHTRYGWGEASTPALHGDYLIVNWDHEGQSYIFALDAKTGDIRWKKERDEPTSWSTPLIVEHKGKTQVIVNATNRVRSYDLKTGEVLWQCGGQTINAIPSPVANDGIVYCMSGYRGATAQALPLDARGDISQTKKILWELGKGTPYIPSPLLMGNRLYFLAGNNPILSCVDAESGKLIYQERLPNLVTLYASPAGVQDRIYLTDRDGTTLVIQHGDKFKPLAVNRLDAPIDASPAIVGNQIFLRAHRHLYCVQADNVKTRILLIGKDRDHPYQTHEYMSDCKLLAKCLEQTPNIETIVSNGWPQDPAKLKDIKAIVLYTANGGDVLLHPRVRKEAMELLENGVGLTAIHWSTGANKINGPQWQKILGGWFSRPFAGSRLLIEKLTLEQAAPDHPICNGWKPYPLHDEYYLDLKFELNIKPVMKVTAKDKDYTVGWTYERPGKKGGRSFGFVCGHFHRNFGETPFRQAVINGILWTAHLQVPPGGAPCAITKKDMELPPPDKKKKKGS